MIGKLPSKLLNPAKAVLGRGLCSVELRHKWETDGFVDKIDIVSRDEMARVRNMVDELQKDYPGEMFPGQLNIPHFTHPTLARICLNNNLLDIMEKLLGPNLVLLSANIFAKYPTKSAGEKYVGAHQDLKYWGITPFIEATAWLAIDQAGPHNGSMMFLPGSHMNGLVEHQKGVRENNVLKDNQDIQLTSEQKSALVQSDLLPGQASIHHGLTVHLSPPNTSTTRRAGLQIQFVTPVVELGELLYDNVYKPDFRQPVLVRGEDRMGRLRYTATMEQLLQGTAHPS